MKRRILILLVGLQFLPIVAITNTTSTTLLAANDKRFDKWFNYGVVEFFQMLADGAPFNFAPKGVRERVRASIIEKSAKLKPAEATQVWKIVNGIISRESKLIQSELYILQLYCRLPISTKHSEALEKLISNKTRKAEVRSLLALDQWRNHPKHDQWFEDLTGRSFAEASAPVSLPGNPGFTLDVEQAELFRKVQLVLEKKRYKSKEFKKVIRWMKLEVSAEYPEMLMQFLRQVKKTEPEDFEEVIDKVLAKRHWVNSPWAPEMVAWVLDKAEWEDDLIHEKVAKRVLPKEAFLDWPELALMIAMSEDGEYQLKDKTLSKKRWRDNPAVRAFTNGKKPTISRLYKAGDKKSLKKWRRIVTERCQLLRQNAVAAAAAPAVAPAVVPGG